MGVVVSEALPKELEPFSLLFTKNDFSYETFDSAPPEDPKPELERSPEPKPAFSLISDTKKHIPPDKQERTETSIQFYSKTSIHCSLQKSATNLLENSFFFFM